MTKVKMKKREAIDLSRVLESVKPTIRGTEIIYNRNQTILKELFKSFDKELNFPEELKEYEKQHSEITEKAGQHYLELSSKKMTKTLEWKLKDFRRVTNETLDGLTARYKDQIVAWKKHQDKILDQEVEFKLETIAECLLPAGIKEEYIQYLRPIFN